MATTLYLRTTECPLGAVVDWTTDIESVTNGTANLLSPNRGAASLEGGRGFGTGGWTGQKILGGTPSLGSRYGWLYQVNAVTISGSITVNLRAREGAMTDNLTIGVIIERRDSSGAYVSTVANSEFGTELTTSDGAKNWSIPSPTSTTFADGDWLAALVVCSNAGTVADAAIGYMSYDGPTAGAAGDSYLTFTETITEYAPPADSYAGLRYPRTALQAVQRAASWFRRHDGLLVPQGA